LTKQADAGAAWENPLIPNAKLLQIYRAMMQARALARGMSAGMSGRTAGLDAGAVTAGTLGLEACLVGAAVDLGQGDLVSDALAGDVMELLRGTGRRAAVQLPGAADAAERIWTALGAASALQAATAQSRFEAKAKGAADATTGRQAGVVVVYALPDSVSRVLWRKALRFAAEHELPVVFVLLPAAGARGSKARKARVGGASALARGCGVPAIAVDANDAVAIYRVAQESIGRAREGGGAALMECVPFALEGMAEKRTAANDAVTGLERYLLQHGVASKAWMKHEAKAFAKRAAR
jgi:TPP-dependent pyruvate/acetoin dehydrogenase alpha subunit